MDWRPNPREAPKTDADGAASARPAERALGTIQRIFVIDDRGTARSILEGLARNLAPSASVEGFSRPLDALEWMNSNTPDLIITDYMMPDMDGIELVRRIRVIPHLAETPIVMITASSDERVRLAAIDAGATDFLTRPIDPKDCVRICSSLLARQRALKSAN